MPEEVVNACVGVGSWIVLDEETVVLGGGDGGIVRLTRSGDDGSGKLCIKVLCLAKLTFSILDSCALSSFHKIPPTLPFLPLSTGRASCLLRKAHRSWKHLIALRPLSRSSTADVARRDRILPPYDRCPAVHVNRISPIQRLLFCQTPSFHLLHSSGRHQPTQSPPTSLFHLALLPPRHYILPYLPKLDFGRVLRCASRLRYCRWR